MKPSHHKSKVLSGALHHAVLLAVLLVLVGWPVVMVFHASWHGRAEAEPGRTQVDPRASLALQTLGLVLLTLSVALPVGVATALGVFRTDLPGRTWWGMLAMLPALVPLDLHASAWLAALGPQGLARSFGIPIELEGLLGAAWVHAMASLSWVVGMVGVAVSTVEAELEEDCLLYVGALGTMWHVTLRRSAGAIVAAGLLVAVLTASEMAVTDLLQVRTYAETVYTEFAISYRVGRATATAVPGLLVLIVLVAIAGGLVVHKVPNVSQALFARRPVFRLGRIRWIASVGCGIVVAATLGVPVASLAWRTGLSYAKKTPFTGEEPLVSPAPRAARAAGERFSGPRWTLATLGENFVASANSTAPNLGYSLALAGGAALITVPLGWWLAWNARQSRVGQALAAGAACILFALPGTVLGIGLKLALERPTKWWGRDPSTWGGLVANGLAGVADSPAVLVWLLSLRSLPFALAVLWSVVRLVNRSLLEAAQIDGAGAWGRFWHVELPICWRSALAAGLVAGVLSLGELGGTVIVAPPGTQPLSLRIFTLAHNGVDTYLAGICLALLLVAAVGAAAVLATLRRAVKRVAE